MAKRCEDGIEYFPLNSDIIHQPKIKLMIADCGVSGWAVLMPLLCRIYSNKGYWLDWFDEDAKLLFAQDDCRLEIPFIDKVIHSLIERDFFSKEKYQQYGILTSDRIQENYLRAKERTKVLKFIKEFCLIDEDFFNRVENKTNKPTIVFEPLPNLKKLKPKVDLSVPVTEVALDKLSKEFEEFLEFRNYLATKKATHAEPEPITQQQPIQQQPPPPPPPVKPPTEEPNSNWINFIYDSGFEHHKQVNNGKSAPEEHFKLWMQFVDFIRANTEYHDLFKSKFISPQSFSKLLLEHNFPQKRWKEVIEKILGTGIKPEHDLFFRIPQFIEIIERSKNGGKKEPVDPSKQKMSFGKKKATNE